MYIKQLILLPVSDLAEQVRNVFEMQISNAHIEELNDSIVDNDGVLDTGDLAHILQDAYIPSVANLEDIDIANGWEGERYRVIIEVVVDEIDEYGTGNRVVLCGFTDRIDVTDKNQIADDTLIYINSVMKINDRVRDDGRGRYVQSRVVSNDQLLAGRFTKNGDNDFVGRPMDVFTLINQAQDLDEDEDDDELVDTRIRFASGVKHSRRSNNMGGRYMSRLIESDRDALAEVLTYNDGAFGASRNIMAGRKSKEGSAHRNEVLSLLYSDCGMADNRSIEYQDLAIFTDDSLDDLDHVTQVGTRDRGDVDYDTCDLDGASEEDEIGILLAHAVPAILSDLALSSIEFVSSNDDDINGTPEIEITDMTSYVSGISDSRLLEDAFRTRFLNEVFDVVSQGGNRVICLEIVSEVTGITSVRIAIGNDDWEERNYASFADSEMVPVITEKLSNLHALKNKYVSLRNNIDDMFGEIDDDDEELDDSYGRRTPHRGILDL